MGQKIYFASDFHFGTDGDLPTLAREKLVVRWLEEIADTAEQIYLVGDIFDYWYEYGSVIPKGYSRFFAQLRRLIDQGVDVQFFTGNHDLWMSSYFTTEFGIPVRRRPIELELQGKKLLIGHGDGLGPGDTGYKLMKKVLSNKVCQWLWSLVHPDLALYIMRKTSSTSRKLGTDKAQFGGLESEWLAQYAERKQSQLQRDYYVFGHRHLPIAYELSDGVGKYINLGDWLHHYTYGEMENGILTIKKYNK